MSRFLKRLLSLVLILAMVCTVLPASALALENGMGLPDRIQTAQTPVHHNPLYEGIVDDGIMVPPEPQLPQADISAADTGSFVTEAQAAAQLRQAMVNRQGSCVLKVATTNSDHNALMQSLFLQALTHTGVPVEGDYIAWQYGSWRAGSNISQSGATYYYTSTFTLTYYTDAAQEARMDTEVDALLDQLDLDNGTEYEKIRGIYDYICANVTYDYANLNDRTYTLKHSAYAALINGTAVCQGYAVLLYRLALELGLDCRLIAGYGGGEAHGWNIVRLDDLYYNLDSTWDAGQPVYSCFLVSEANFQGHVRGNMNGINYAGEAFHAAYPMSPVNYSAEPTATSGSCGDHVYWRFDSASGTLTIFGSGAMTDYEGQMYLPWATWIQQVRTLVVENGVTTVGNAACVGMNRLQRVVLPEGITSIGDSAFALTVNLQQIVLPRSLKHIGVQAFDSSGLTSVTIPAGVESIGQFAFFFCENLNQVTFRGDVPALPGGGIFMGVSATGYYPSGNATWTEAARNAFGGNIAWVAADTENTVPSLEGIFRIYGDDRIATSMGLAEELKVLLGVPQFDTIVVASALNFPDALTGSYLAAAKSAPILLTYEAVHSQIRSYIASSLAPGGTVYILGGESAVSGGFENALKAEGIRVKRLAGSDRFGTNLAILQEVGVESTQEVLICTATGFADSLSASAAGLPILLVHGSLTAQQKDFLVGTSGNFVIIGGDSAVSRSLENELRAMGSVERLGGTSRYETSVMVARRFVGASDAVVLAYARNYPDGLCGGAVAAALKAPLILTDNFDPTAADAYVEGISAGIVVGSTNLISDAVVMNIFDLN